MFTTAPPLLPRLLLQAASEEERQRSCAAAGSSGSGSGADALARLQQAAPAAQAAVGELEFVVDEAELAGLSAREREAAIKRAKNREAARRWVWLWRCAGRAVATNVRACPRCCTADALREQPSPAACSPGATYRCIPHSTRNPGLVSARLSASAGCGQRWKRCASEPNTTDGRCASLRLHSQTCGSRKATGWPRHCLYHKRWRRRTAAAHPAGHSTAAAPSSRLFQSCSLTTTTTTTTTKLAATTLCCSSALRR